MIVGRSPVKGEPVHGVNCSEMPPARSSISVGMPVDLSHMPLCDGSNPWQQFG